MDLESSYESDVSESWSLVDIYLNEESSSSTEAPTFPAKIPSSDLKNASSKKRNDIEITDFVKKCKEINRRDFRGVSDSDSDSSSKNNEVATCSKEELNQKEPPSKRSSEDFVKNDSGDTESIEILDLDGNQESETDRLDISVIDQLDFATYQSDDEESFEEGVNNGNKTSDSTVIKRKRQRLNRNPENSVHSVNGETNTVKTALKSCSNDTKEESRTTGVKFNSRRQCPVYKHYRNNVANTFLNLSVGVIFAGVACIAIGHFLGVQNAAETAVELAENLKKLQLENAALQSRLFHLNNVLLNQEMNSKELPQDQPPKKVPCEEVSKDKLSKTPQTDLNNAVLSEIRSSLKSIEWLSKMNNILQKNRKKTEAERELNFHEFGKYIHDQLNILKDKQEEGARLFEDTDKKISKVLQKIINRLLSSHDNIEILYQRIIQLKNKLNYKANGIFSDFTEGIKSEKAKRENQFPVTELDLQTIQYSPKNKIGENSDLCEFPQPEKYYEPTSSNRTFEFGKAQKKNKKKHKQKKDKKYGENIRKSEKAKKDKKRDKAKRVVSKDEHSKKSYQPGFNETKIQTKKYSKLEIKDAKLKRSFKRHKKWKRVLLSKLQKDTCSNDKPRQPPSEPQCFNLTGYWMFKWADGRKELRRHHALGNWQFERAKARKEVRKLDANLNWQFERAKARKNLRGDNSKEGPQYKGAPTKSAGWNGGRWQRGKQTKYNGKEFFYEIFSWF